MSRPSKGKQINNSLTQLTDNLRNNMTGGSSLSGYGTIAWANNYALLTLNQIMLTYLYTGNGLFQTAIQVPVQDAISKGIELESDELSPEDIDDLMDWWEHHGIWETILDSFTWTRLYGGGGIVINTAIDPSIPMRIEELRNSDLEFYDVDRWQLSPASGAFRGTIGHMGNILEAESFMLYTQEIHASRIMLMTGKKAPSRVRRNLMGWGMSEGERMIRDLNLYLKTQDVLYEILDEAKIDVYRMAGYAQKLATIGGTDIIQKRVQLTNEMKNYLNALLLDKEDEFEQKSLTFTGLAEVSNENRIGIASALRITMVKLFGLSPSGFSTGDADLENYNQMVESEVRSKLNTPVRKMLELTMFNKFGFVPSFRFKWPPLKEATEKEVAEINTQKITQVTSLYSAGLITGTEAMKELQAAGAFSGASSIADGLIEPTPQEMPKNRNLTPPRSPEIKNSYSVYRNQNEFEEQDHKRDESGKFTSGGGNSEKGGAEGSSERTGRDESQWIDYLTKPTQKLKEDLKKQEKAYVDMVKKDYPNLKKEVTEEQSMSILRYTDGSYKKINQQLMKGGNDIDIQRQIEDLSAFIDLHPLKEDTVLYRGLKLEPGEKWSVGEVRDNEGFCSASSSKDIARQFASGTMIKGNQQAIIVFKAPAGSSIAPIDGLGKFKNKEAEFIGKPGLKFKVTKATEGYNGRMEYEVEIV